MVYGHTRAEEIEFMSSPEKWPHTVVLPVKRERGRGEFPETGYLRQTSMTTPAPAPEPVIYLGTIFDRVAKDKVVTTKHYPSIEAMVDDGWVVD